MCGVGEIGKVVVGREGGRAYGGVSAILCVLGCLLASTRGVWSVRLYMASAGVLCAYLVSEVTTRHVERASVASVDQKRGLLRPRENNLRDKGVLLA